MMWTLHTLKPVGVVSGAVLLAMTISCAQDQVAKPMPGGPGRTDTPIQQIEDLPTWITQKGAAFSGERRVFYGVGNAAAIRNAALRRRSTEAAARRDLQQTFQVYVAGLNKQYMAETTAGDMDKVNVEQHIEDVMKQVTSGTLVGSSIVEYWEHPTRNEAYALARLDLEQFWDVMQDYMGAKGQYKELDAQVREFVRKNATKAHEELNRELGQGRKAKPHSNVVSERVSESEIADTQSQPPLDQEAVAELDAGGSYQHGTADVAGELPDIRVGYISGQTFSNKPVKYTAINGLAMFEGDIVLGTVDELEKAKGALDQGSSSKTDSHEQAGVVIAGDRYHWPDGVVPYTIEKDLSSTLEKRIDEAIRHWETNTNMRLKKHTDETNYVAFRKGAGCSARVGMTGGKQFISLGKFCSTGNVIHEIGHAIGLWHEQSREDRDTHITIVWKNIRPYARHNFLQHITDGDDIGPYDYQSIMHYPDTAFAIDRKKKTIIPKTSKPIGQRKGLSPADITTVNQLYPK